MLNYKGYAFTDYATVIVATFYLGVSYQLEIRNEMSGLTLVSEGSDLLAEPQRVQRLLHWRCYFLRGCRMIKSSLFNIHWPLKL